MAPVSPPPQQLRYPLKNIGEYDDYLKIEIVDYVPPGLGQQGAGFALGTADQSIRNNKKLLQTIILPIPQNISDSNSASWGENSLNSLAGGLLSGTEKVMTSSTPFNTGLSAVQGALDKITGAVTDATGQKAASTTFAGLAVQTLLNGDANINQLVSRATGAVVNQNVELLFGGVTIRTPFQFTYDLIPRSKEESEVVKNIIRIFKQNMSASKGSAESSGGGFFVKSPNVFLLSYMSGGKNHPFLNRFKPCALINMGVNYTASGMYATYPDATPVHLQLSLAFQELSVVYAEDYNEPEGKEGVGY